MKSRAAPLLIVQVGVVLFAAGVIGWIGYELWGFYREEAFWTIENIAETQRRGDVIVQAIESHIHAHGTPPGSLESVVDLEALSPLTGNDAWAYFRRNDGFVLRFSANKHEYPCAYYDSAVGEWYHDN